MRTITQLVTPVLLCILLLGCEPAEREVVPAIDDARQLMEDAANAYTEAWNTGNLEILDTLVANDFRRNFPDTSYTGREALAQEINAIRSAYSDFNVNLLDVLYDGNRAAARFEISGTQDGPWMGIPPTNRLMKTVGMSILRFSNGQIQEEWIVTNQAHISRQLGWDQLPEPPVPPTD